MVQRRLVLGERERKEEKLLLYNFIKVVCKNGFPTETDGMVPDNLSCFAVTTFGCPEILLSLDALLVSEMLRLGRQCITRLARGS